MLPPLEFACGNRCADPFNISHGQRRTAVRRVPTLKQLKHDEGIDAASK